MMKIRLIGFAGLLSFVLCTAIPQTAPAQVPQKSARPVPKINQEQLRNAKIQAKKQTPKYPLGYDPRILEFDPRILENIEFCTVAPSCGPHYSLTKSLSCEGGFGGNCYVCSLNKEIRSVATCMEGFHYFSPTEPAGWYEDNVKWEGSGFHCASECVQTCLNKGCGGDFCEGCIDACPGPSPEACPEGFRFYAPTRFGYYCWMPGYIGSWEDRVCRQCGFDEAYIHGGNGAVYCDEVREEKFNKK